MNPNLKQMNPNDYTDTRSDKCQAYNEDRLLPNVFITV